MNTLFPVDTGYPEGFEYEPGFISREEEDVLLEHIKGIELHTFVFQGFEAKRRTASFGYDYSFDSRKLSRGQDIPKVFTPLIQSVANKLSINPSQFGELLVTEYPVGAVINWHRDAPPFNIIAGISLNADCIFKLRPHSIVKEKNVMPPVEGQKTRKKSAIISVPVQRRSLYIMKGPARSAWQHSTAPVTDVRYSITLRTLL